MNSFSGVERALDAEFARQAAILDAHGRVEQQTLLWDADRGTVRPARSKEGSHDYRYFPDPDLPPLVLLPAWIDQQRKALPELPEAKRARLGTEYALPAYDAGVITSEPELAHFFESVVRAGADPKTGANWIMGEVMTTYNERGAFPVSPEGLARLIALVRDGRLSHQAAKRVYAELALTPAEDPAAVAERLGLTQVSDESALTGWVDEVLAAHPGEVSRFRNGESKLMAFFVGQVMKRSKGKADPKGVQPLLQQRLRQTAESESSR